MSKCKAKVTKKVEKKVSKPKAKLVKASKRNEPKQRKIRPYEKLLLVMLHGNVVSKEDIVEQLGWGAERGSKVKGPKIYNISSYVWDIKNVPHVEGELLVVKSLRDGKKVTGYQLISVDLAKKYLAGRGLYKEPVAPVKVEAPENTEATA